MAAPLIGVLAGIGPKSTAPFVDRVIGECEALYGAKEDLDFPPLLVLSWPTPHYSDRRLDPEALRSAILAGVQKLALSGSAFIGTPSNTAHVYYDHLTRECPVPIVHMIDEAFRALPASSQRIALLASRSTADSLLYQRRAELLGKRVIDTTVIQGDVDGLIESAKAGTLADAGARWSTLLDKVDALAADSILVASTYLSSVATTAPCPLVDARRQLARVLITRWRELLASEQGPLQTSQQ